MWIRCFFQCPRLVFRPSIRILDGICGLLAAQGSARYIGGSSGPRRRGRRWGRGCSAPLVVAALRLAPLRTLAPSVKVLLPAVLLSVVVEIYFFLHCSPPSSPPPPSPPR